MILALGVVACRTFEVALHVRPGFRAGPLKFLDVGTWGLSAFVLLWVLFSAATAMLLWIRVLFAPTVDRLTRPITSRIANTSATALAALVALAGILWWTGITWWYADMFSSMFAMQSGKFSGPDGAPLLNTAFRVMQKNYGMHAAILCFVLLFVVWRWWPRLERRAEDLAFVRAMKWAPIAICILVLACATAPRRLVWERFQVVLSQKPAVVRYRNKRGGASALLERRIERQPADRQTEFTGCDVSGSRRVAVHRAPGVAVLWQDRRGDVEEAKMVRRLLVTGALLLAMLGVPRPSHAGLLDFIWEMTGPQMLGVGYGCFFTTSFEREECRVHGVTAPVEYEHDAASRRPLLCLRHVVHASSTDKNSKTQEYDWFDVQMVMIEPGLAFRSIGESGVSRVRVYHGVGVTWNYLFGKDMRGFDKFGYKFTPIDVAYKQVAVAFEMRLYPNGFTDDEFGFGPRVTFDRPYETTYGLKVSWAIGGNKPFGGPTK